MKSGMLKGLMAKLTVASIMIASAISTASAAINTQDITDGLNVIWTIIGNFTDNFGKIITLVAFGAVIALIYILVRYLKKVLGSAVEKQ